MARGKAANTTLIENTLAEVLAETYPMTVRQAYYQLVSKHVVENNKAQYERVSRILVDMRQSGAIPWWAIEDRNRRPRTVSMWNNLEEFASTAVQSYRRNVWQQQRMLVEVWLEKDALSGIFEEVLAPYGVTLNVGRGYDGWSSIQAAAQRYLAWHNIAIILYFGDFDPSGMDMLRSLEERLQFFGARPFIRKCAITQEDIERFNLPPNIPKTTDTRHDGFVAQWGTDCVELDALPVTVLQNRIQENVEVFMDMTALETAHATEEQERLRLIQLLKGATP